MTLPGASNSRWAAFEASELDELALALDHRLAEAEGGNAYVFWRVVGFLLADLAAFDPDIAHTTPDAVRERMRFLEARDVG